MRFYKPFATKKQEVEMRKEFFQKIYPAVKGSTSLWARYQRVRHPKLYEAAVQEEKRGKLLHALKGSKSINAKLKAENAKLSELCTSKDEFMGVMAHDLRGPFNGIIGFADVMGEAIGELPVGKPMENDTKGELKGYISQVSNSANRALAILDRFLEIYRINAGKLDFTPKQFDLLEVASAQLDLYSANASKKGVALVNNMPAGTPAFANPDMAGEVIGNLLSNAIKFTPSGGKVSISCKASACDAIEISVSDTGVGIPQGNLDMLLVQNKSITTKGTSNEKGTGFGILKVKEIVARMGGKLWAESKEGEGTTFRFTLPASEVPRQEPVA
jgi:two-component system, sensor histidine kinase and response regulator